MPAKGIEINPSILRVRYRAHGYTMEELAHDIGVDRQTVHEWCWGKSNPKAENFVKLCSQLRIDPKILMMNSGDLVSLAKHDRLISYAVAQVTGENDSVDEYSEARQIEIDILADSYREDAEQDVTVSDPEIFDQEKASSDSESDSTTSDEV